MSVANSGRVESSSAVAGRSGVGGSQWTPSSVPLASRARPVRVPSGPRRSVPQASRVRQVRAPRGPRRSPPARRHCQATRHRAPTGLRDSSAVSTSDASALIGAELSTTWSDAAPASMTLLATRPNLPAATASSSSQMTTSRPLTADQSQSEIEPCWESALASYHVTGVYIECRPARYSRAAASAPPTTTRAVPSVSAPQGATWVPRTVPRTPSCVCPCSAGCSQPGQPHLSV